MRSIRFRSNFFDRSPASLLPVIITSLCESRPDCAPIEAGVVGARVVFDKVYAPDPEPVGGDVVYLQALIGIGPTGFDYHSVGFGDFGVREGFVSREGNAEPGPNDQGKGLLEVIIKDVFVNDVFDII